MRISVFGLGYVGSVSAVCLADLGHEVIGVDIVPQKVADLKAGRAPVKEPDLDELLQKNLAAKQIRFTESTQEAVLESDCAMITVGTPSDENGRVNLNAVERCISSIVEIVAESAKTEFSIVIRSTVPPKTTQQMSVLAATILAKRQSDCKLHFSMNPEFTREGVAVKDFLEPAIIVFGMDEESAKTRLAKIYEGVAAETIWVSSKSAELVKYTNNAFHAMKVAFANEIGRIADAYHIDGQDIMQILCADKKLNISTKYLRPGFAFGGSCLPKDLRGIDGIAQQAEVDIPMLRSILPSNDLHISHFKNKILAQQPKKIALLGIAFKEKTDDLRESPGLRLACELIASGIPLKMLDVNLQTRFLMGRNRDYIDTMLPNWENYYTTDVEALFAFADTIVITNKEPIYREWANQYGANKQLIYTN